MKQQNRMKYDVAFYRRRNAYKNASQRLKQMPDHSDSKEFARELSEILREYIGDKLNLQGKAITAEEVQARLKESNYEVQQAEETRKLLEKCETLQYAPMTQGSTKQLLGESEKLIKVLEKQS
jgi:predicted nuclease with TOPRIM domain